MARSILTYRAVIAQGMQQQRGRPLQIVPVVIVFLDMRPASLATGSLPTEAWACALHWSHQAF